MPSRGYKALLISLALYALVAPLSTYNTFAMIWLGGSRFPLTQLLITIPMIFFAIIAGQSIGKHSSANARTSLERWLWIAGFYIIGPPVMYFYYRRQMAK